MDGQSGNPGVPRDSGVGAIPIAFLPDTIVHQASPSISRGRGRPRGSVSNRRAEADSGSRVARGRPLGSSTLAASSERGTGRGRPRGSSGTSAVRASRGRGRPRKSVVEAASPAASPAARGRGRPPSRVNKIAKPVTSSRGRPRSSSTSKVAASATRGRGRRPGSPKKAIATGRRGRPKGSKNRATSDSRSTKSSKTAPTEATAVFVVMNEEVRVYSENITNFLGTFASLESANTRAAAEFKARYVDYIKGDDVAEGLEGFVEGEAFGENQAYAQKDTDGCLRLTGIDGGDGDQISIYVKRQSVS